ncbi:substrate-binding domain-containing protein [Geomonas sp. Red32]|uniref:PstS family phosphate ABC transporter substrate-binding protein n=1 Tax=Geomonas sp. Red32 TaxID=2912856 RepID=UPI00202CA8AD|nr:substrate-binding domain-containing protein [Geomonas sp. Red32]MCM0081408.1 substrate-binding domain-containing protein [Geomonas sp. Red32]
MLLTRPHTPLLVALFLLLSLAAPPLISSANAVTVIRIGGTGSALPSLHLLAEAFSAAHPDVTVQVLPSLGSSGGLAAMQKGAIDLAVTGRPLKKCEARAGTVIEYARSPFLFAAHPSVNDADLTIADLELIYSGKRNQWSDDSPLRLVLRPFNDIDTAIIMGISRGMADSVEKAYSRPGMTIATTNEETISTLAATPGALGTVTLTELVALRHPLKVLSFDGIKPTLRHLAEGAYPLEKRFYLVVPDRASSSAKMFARFVTSAKGRSILRSSGNIPVPEKER